MYIAKWGLIDPKEIELTWLERAVMSARHGIPNTAILREYFPCNYGMLPYAAKPYSTYPFNSHQLEIAPVDISNVDIHIPLFTLSLFGMNAATNAAIILNNAILEVFRGIKDGGMPYSADSPVHVLETEMLHVEAAVTRQLREYDANAEVTLSITESPKLEYDENKKIRVAPVFWYMKFEMKFVNYENKHVLPCTHDMLVVCAADCGSNLPIALEVEGEYTLSSRELHEAVVNDAVILRDGQLMSIKDAGYDEFDSGVEVTINDDGVVFRWQSFDDSHVELMSGDRLMITNKTYLTLSVAQRIVIEYFHGEN